jgi:sterol desaturase/sphingolipid hydroxylase (fatty acid hydroxylase superfamily)
MEFGQEILIRFGFFVGVLLLMALWEALAPRRHPHFSRAQRWPSNLGLVAIDAITVRLLVPLGAVGMAVIAEQRHWGVLNHLELPAYVAVPVAVLFLDLVIYLQHRLFHAVPILWRLHMVHHADLDFDVTTGVRFHTIEILLSLGIKMAAVAVLGASAMAVLIFEILLNATSMFNHGNVWLPGPIDRVLRLLVVTPEMHRIHHSVHRRETNSNFGFNLPWWDFIFGTYRRQPADGHEGMTIGLTQFRESWVQRLHWMLLMPVFGDVGDYPAKQHSPDIPSSSASGKLE